MIVYNETIKVTWEIHDNWMLWMKSSHIPDILATGLFEDYRMMRLLEVDETDGPTYAVQYTARSAADYNRYIAEFSTEIRDRSYEKWGANFIAFRSVLQVVN